MKKLTLILSLLLFSSCQNHSFKKSFTILTPQGSEIHLGVAVSLEEQQQGLSGIQDSDFENNQGLLFYYQEENYRQFWMPDTYFDLDLFYLDKDLRIIDLVRKLEHHKGRSQHELIPRARPVWCRHVIELKHESPIAKSLQIGDLLKIKDSQTSVDDYFKKLLK